MAINDRPASKFLDGSFSRAFAVPHCEFWDDPHLSKRIKGRGPAYAADSRRLVLLALANHAQPDGTGSYPSVATIAAYTGRSESTVQRCITWLGKNGWVGVKLKAGRGEYRGANAYTIRLDALPELDRYSKRRGALPQPVIQMTGSDWQPNQSSEAVNQSSEAVNQSSEAVNQSSEAVNQSSGRHPKREELLKEKEEREESARGAPAARPMRETNGQRILSKKEFPPCKQLAVDMARVSEGLVVFGKAHMPALTDLLRDYSAEEVVSVFRAFFTTVDTDNTKDLRYGPRNFLDGAETRLITARRLKQEREAQAAQLSAIKDKMQTERQAEIAAELAEREAAEAAEAELIEDTL